MTQHEARLSGQTLYGDDFTFDEITRWYNEEKEAYANLGNADNSKYVYTYHALNKLYGFKYIKHTYFDRALGFGAAWGHELQPLISNIGQLHIIEPSEAMRSEIIGSLKPVYKSPQITGQIPYPDQYFNLITCFAVLHHIPNVSYVFNELCRVAAPGAFILVREPVISMGDWSAPRTGLTKNERGIPLTMFREMIALNNIELVRENLFFTMTPFLQRAFSKISKKPVHTSALYLKADKWLSKAMRWNLHYHATNKLQRIAPQAVYYVLRKK